MPSTTREPWIEEFDALIDRDQPRVYLLMGETHLRELAAGRTPQFVIDQARSVLQHFPTNPTLFVDGE